MGSVLRSMGYRMLAAVGSVVLETRSRGAKHLRVLGYHDVPDADMFERQMTWVRRNLTPISLGEALDVLSGDKTVNRPALITFDDGDPSVVEVGQPVLDRLGIEALLSVCPGVIDSDQRFWWEIVDLAAKHGLEADGIPLDSHAVAMAKGLPDGQRRSLVSRLARQLGDVGVDISRRQLTTSQLRSWTDAGHALGNHTWDHPILTMCSEEEQRRQIIAADDWLRQRDLMPVATFAYPNGNATAYSRSLLEQCGYAMDLMFDHRVAVLPAEREVSRLRVNADDPMAEFVARVSGIHPLIHAVRFGN